MSHWALGLNIVENTWAGGEGEPRLKQVVEMGENAPPPAHPPRQQLKQLRGGKKETVDSHGGPNPPVEQLRIITGKRNSHLLSRCEDEEDNRGFKIKKKKKSMVSSA